MSARGCPALTPVEAALVLHVIALHRLSNSTLSDADEQALLVLAARLEECTHEA
jgi:hypothetical protein